jgi:hypothetical protein
MVETKSSEMRVKDVKKDGLSLHILVESDEREPLADGGRRFCVDYVSKTPELSTWAEAGVEQTSGVFPVDSTNPEADVRDQIAAAKKRGKEIDLVYRQWFQMTRMI